MSFLYVFRATKNSDNVVAPALKLRISLAPKTIPPISRITAQHRRPRAAPPEEGDEKQNEDVDFIAWLQVPYLCP